MSAVEGVDGFVFGPESGEVGEDGGEGWFIGDEGLEKIRVGDEEAQGDDGARGVAYDGGRGFWRVMLY